MRATSPTLWAKPRSSKGASTTSRPSSDNCASIKRTADGAMAEYDGLDAEWNTCIFDEDSYYGDYYDDSCDSETDVDYNTPWENGRKALDATRTTLKTGNPVGGLHVVRRRQRHLIDPASTKINQQHDPRAGDLDELKRCLSGRDWRPSVPATRMSVKAFSAAATRDLPSPRWRTLGTGATRVCADLGDEGRAWVVVSVSSEPKGGER